MTLKAPSTSESLPPDCTVYGSVTGSAESAFACSSGAESGFVSGLWMAIAAAMFLALWSRLVWQAWKRVLHSKYSWGDLANVVLWPMSLFVFVFSMLSSI